MKNSDYEALIVLAIFSVTMIVVGMLTALLGDWLWYVMGRITTGSTATMWLAHGVALFISISIVWSALLRILDKEWPWDKT